MIKVDDYLELLFLQEGIEQLNEADVEKVTSKLESKSKTLVMQLKNAFNPKKPKDTISRMNKLVSFIPKLDVKKVDKYLSKKVKDFKKMKGLSLKVLENSIPDANKNLIEGVSSLVVVLSLFSKKGENKSSTEILKSNLKELVMKTRKFADDFDTEGTSSSKGLIPPEYITDIAIALAAITIALSILTLAVMGGMALQSGIALVFTGIAAVAPTLVVGVILILLVFVIRFIADKMK